MMAQRLSMAAANGYVKPVFQLDAGDSGSYSGSGQGWANLIANPADGEAQTAYDFWRGANNTATTDDPTFNGSAGGKSADEYWSFDGGDYFALKSTNTTFLNSLHKDSANFTLVVWLQMPNPLAAGNFFVTHDASGTAIGIEFTITILGRLNLQACNGSGSVMLNLSSGAGLAASAGSKHMVAVSYNEAAGTGMFYLNGSSEAFTGTYASPSASAANLALLLGRRGSNNLPSGYRIYQQLAYNRALTKGQLDYHWRTYKGRYGL